MDSEMLGSLGSQRNSPEISPANDVVNISSSCSPHYIKCRKCLWKLSIVRERGEVQANNDFRRKLCTELPRLSVPQAWQYNVGCELLQGLIR